MADSPLPGLMVGHRQAPPDDGAITITRLPLQYLGGLKAQPLAASVVVLRYGEHAHPGPRSAPGARDRAVPQDIDSDGLTPTTRGGVSACPGRHAPP